MATDSTLSAGTLVLGIFAEALFLDLNARAISNVSRTCHYIRSSIKSSYKLSRRIALYEDLYKHFKLTAKSHLDILLSIRVQCLLINKLFSPVCRDCIDTSPELQERIDRIPCIPIPRALGTEINPIFELALASHGYKASMRREDNSHRYILTISHDPRPWLERFSNSLRTRIDGSRYLFTGPKPPTVKVQQQIPWLPYTFDLQVHEATFGDVMKGGGVSKVKNDLSQCAFMSRWCCGQEQH